MVRANSKLAEIQRVHVATCVTLRNEFPARVISAASSFIICALCCFNIGRLLKRAVDVMKFASDRTTLEVT